MLGSYLFRRFCAFRISDKMTDFSSPKIYYFIWVFMGLRGITNVKQAERKMILRKSEESVNSHWFESPLRKSNNPTFLTWLLWDDHVIFSPMISYRFLRLAHIIALAINYENLYWVRKWSARKPGIPADTRSSALNVHAELHCTVNGIIHWLNIWSHVCEPRDFQDKWIFQTRRMMLITWVSLQSLGFYSSKNQSKWGYHRYHMIR